MLRVEAILDSAPPAGGGRSLPFIYINTDLQHMHVYTVRVRKKVHTVARNRDNVV